MLCLLRPPDLGFVSPPASATNPQDRGFTQPQPPSQSRVPIVKDRKIGRNEKVTIRKGDETKIIKWKKAQELIQSEGWTLEK